MKKRYIGGVVDQVDWALVWQAMSKVGWSRRKWVTKYTTWEICPQREYFHNWWKP